MCNECRIAFVSYLQGFFFAGRVVIKEFVKIGQLNKSIVKITFHVIRGFIGDVLFF